ncbi:uncharacterized protein JN550_005708 [Neoarthrinium moseri]|uniref:uncharacterized protein n=1 Tax=Neoarthrinium moseri TaxID=1658444 RepID=UPI001FDBDE86|nr:uncharacterized protein JN550_005708 [Neoarthrinium moseri]KAI1869727.1 hypothetical protein JN550_005708 [Neoarthrinium moseri]
MEYTLNDALDLAAKLDDAIRNSEAINRLQDDGLRRRLREASRKLSIAPLQLALARIGVERGIFDLLSKGDILTSADLATQTQIDPVLCRRLLRYWQSQDMISQPNNDAYKANNVTKALSSASGSSGISYFHEMISQSFWALPKFIRETGYQNPEDPNKCSWHFGHNTDLNPFPWLRANPEHMQYFLPWMATQREGLPIFLDTMNVNDEFWKKANDSTPLFVDVGGALGHQCIAVRKRYQDLQGRVILQEQGFIIDQVESHPLPEFKNVETMRYDFFTPQPIQGARIYYFRNIFHDWPDNKCIEILENLKGAMKEDSVLFIDEMVLPEKGAPWRATQLDMAMMTCLAAKERTAIEWEALLNKGDFKVQRICKYTDECEDCIIVATPKSGAENRLATLS